MDGTDAKRPYRMQARAQAAQETGRRILQAMTELYMERWLDQFSLEDVARRADVTVQTVLRRFGSKEELLAAVGAELEQHVSQQRGEAPIGDIKGVVRNLFDHYEEVGELVLRSLAQEGMHPSLQVLMDRGRRVHYEWVERVFAPWLAGAAGQERERLRAQLITLTDIYVWKLLRRDLGLDRHQAESALREMLGALYAAMGESQPQGGTDGHD
ncbi:MAG TPA: TetR/AcrR family transcriptional regulator [Ardenticatenaceae bacterium]